MAAGARVHSGAHAIGLSRQPTLLHRPYREVADLPLLQDLVRRCWRADAPAAWLHPGDLAWWRFQHEKGGWTEHVRVYSVEGHAAAGRLNRSLGFTPVASGLPWLRGVSLG